MLDVKIKMYVKYYKKKKSKVSDNLAGVKYLGQADKDLMITDAIGATTDAKLF